MQIKGISQCHHGNCGQCEIVATITKISSSFKNTPKNRTTIFISTPSYSF